MQVKILRWGGCASASSEWDPLREAESSEPGFQFIKTPFQVTTSRTIDTQMYIHVLFLFSLSLLSVGPVRACVRVCAEVDIRCLLQLLYTLFSERGVPTVFGGCRLDRVAGQGIPPCVHIPRTGVVSRPCHSQLFSWGLRL